MEFNEAYLAIVKASIEQDIKEIPLLLSATEFSGKKCLEIGAGPLARLAVKLLKSEYSPKHITCLDLYNVEKINYVAKKEKLEKKLTAVKTDDPLRLPFDDKSFDIIYAGWIPSELLRNKNYLDELMRVSRTDVVFIMSGLNGDIPPMRDLILKEDETQQREELRTLLTDYFSEKGFNVDTSLETTLSLDFHNLQSIFDTFHYFDFRNNLSADNQGKLKKYLEPKVHDFKDNLYIFHAWKS